ncbi:MAG: hypothetical protein ACRCWJ_16595 [Casimicrobium sp.]
MREPEQWHLSKGVQISHIISTIAALLAAVFFITNMKQESAVHNAKQDAQIETLDRRVTVNREDAKTERNEMTNKFNQIDAKLDVLMQRTAPRR